MSNKGPLPQLPLSWDAVLGDDNLLAIVLGARDAGKSLTDICQVVSDYCTTKRCSDFIYETVLREGMGVRVVKPPDIIWPRWMGAWCKVVLNPHHFYNGYNLWLEFPVRVDTVESLRWADSNGVLDYGSFDLHRTLTLAGERFDIDVIDYICDKYKIPMKHLVFVISVTVRLQWYRYRQAAQDAHKTPEALEKANTYLNTKAVRRLLEIYDKVQDKQPNPDYRVFMAQPNFGYMIGHIEGFAGEAQDVFLYDDTSDADYIMDWCSQKHHEVLRVERVQREMWGDLSF